MPNDNIKSKRGSASEGTSAEGDTGQFDIEKDAGSRSFVGPNETRPLGGVIEEELVAVANAELWCHPNLESPELRLSVEGLARVIANRMDHSDWTRDPKQLAIFIVSDRPRDLSFGLMAKRAPIIDNGSQALTGRLWISGPNLHSGYYVTVDEQDPGDFFGRIEELGFGDWPAFIFDPMANDPEVRYYPKGIVDEDRVQRFLVAEKTFSIETLDRVLDLFYEQNVITPDAAGSSFNPWINGPKYVPRERTEAFLQGWLKSILWVAFRGGCQIHFEMPGSEGRCDLLISSRHAGSGVTWVYHATLELKILRSLSSGNKPVSSKTRAEAIRGGLLQAIAYKRTWRATYGLLCCYDMRKPQHCDGIACFDAIRGRASRNSILLRHYRVYGTSGDLRADRYCGPSSSSQN